MLEHSCRANCSKSFTGAGGLIIHSAIPIAKGTSNIINAEYKMTCRIQFIIHRFKSNSDSIKLKKIILGDHISICYTDSLWGTANRRHHLSETKFFECICDRCKDPTEFNTMFNALKCKQM